MKKSAFSLLIKILILGIPLYLLMGYSYLFPMNYMPIEYTMWSEQKDSINEVSAKTVIMGDSRAKSSIMPTELGDDTYNLAIGGVTAIEMYYAMDEYLKKNEAPERAIIIFAPYHFCDMDNWGQTVTYNYLSVPQLCEVYMNALSVGETDKLGEHFFTDELSCRLRLPNKYMDSLYNASFIGRYADNKAKYDSVRADLGYTVFGEDDSNDGESYETHHEIFDSSKLVMLYYDKLLNLCEDNNIHVIIEQAPVNEPSMELITEKFWAGFHDMLGAVKEKHPSFTVVESVPQYENECFGDNNHLNKRGARRFTEYVRGKYF